MLNRSIILCGERFLILNINEAHYTTASLPITDTIIAQRCAVVLLTGDAGSSATIPQCDARYSKNIGYLLLIFTNEQIPHYVTSLLFLECARAKRAI